MGLRSRMRSLPYGLGPGCVYMDREEKPADRYDSDSVTGQRIGI